MTSYCRFGNENKRETEKITLFVATLYFSRFLVASFWDFLAYDIWSFVFPNESSLIIRYFQFKQCQS